MSRNLLSMPAFGKVRNRLTLFFFSSFLMSSPAFSQPAFDPFLERLLKKHPQRFAKILKERKQYELQILYTKIDRDRKGQPQFAIYRYGVDANRYFYPASTIKLAAAALALEKLNNLNISGLNKHTAMLTLAERPSQTEALHDSTSSDGLPSVGHYIRKVLVASDNDAYNRLYEFLGQQYFNETMHKKGYDNFRAIHRLGVSLTPEENRHTNPVRFISGDRVIYEQKAGYCETDFSAPKPILRGKAYMDGDRIVNEPMDFREKNAFGLADQQLFLRNLMFPERASEQQKLNLTDDDYRFLYQYMSQLPIETQYPAHYNETMDDASMKYLLFGKTRKRTPRQIRSFNKTGEAYGYLLDNAYIADFEMGIEFMLAAVIYCNKDQVLNDDSYDYDTIGYQFMADLGKTILEYELGRRRNNRPDIEKFEVEYDK